MKLEELNRDILEKEMRTIWKIWVAFFLSLFSYIMVCNGLEKEVLFKEYGSHLKNLKYLFYALSLIFLYFSHYLRKTMLKQPSIKSDLKIIKRAKKLGKPAILVKYSTIVLISLAFSEAIAIYGVSYFFLSGDYQTLYVLVGISAITMLYHRPKAKELAHISIASEDTASSLNTPDASDSH
ncbi:MAG: hypothetical protein A2V86_06090 [Deltaproteobacteria bacterium RBG_16_49_23]|nr:MAG: hypothetical protein A2V86_06090 [Deltaproteobacteria bacterium RBG_16_49_23]